MSDLRKISRREFMKRTGQAGGGLVFALTFASACQPGPGTSVPASGEVASVAPNVYVNIRNDGIVEIYCHRSEMGQGIRTSLPQVIADELDPDEQLLPRELLRLGCELHDVGKIGIPDSILLKPGPLTTSEYAMMREHAEIGYRILSGSSSQLLNMAAQIAHTHHERWDGTGYPAGLLESSIPLGARVLRVADSLDAAVDPAHPVVEPGAAQGEAGHVEALPGVEAEGVEVGAPVQVRDLPGVLLRRGVSRAPHELAGVGQIVVLGKADKKVHLAFVKQFHGLDGGPGSGEREAVLIGFHQNFGTRHAADDGAFPANQVSRALDREGFVLSGIDHGEGG